MCGRFTIAIVIGLNERFRTKPPSFEMWPRYNISPSQEVPVIVESSDDSPGREMVMMKWGLIPGWAADIKIGSRIINARADSLISGPAFRYNIQHHRCLVPATGFYEWRQLGKKKIPCYIRRKDGALLAFAGLYDIWRGPDASILKTFAIVTIEPNSLVAPLHNRMPAILSIRNEDTWIRGGPITGRDLGEILIPYPEDELETYRVSSAVNKPDYESPELIRRITESL